jgi:hypothetical protein
MRARLAKTHPELDDFCDDYTHGFRTFAQQTAKDFHIIPAATHEAVDGALSGFEPAPYVVPSSGAVVIAEILGNFHQPDDTITLAGFSHQGWEWHPWDAERQWVSAQVLSGRLARIHSNDNRFIA